MCNITDWEFHELSLNINSNVEGTIQRTQEQSRQELKILIVDDELCNDEESVKGFCKDFLFLKCGNPLESFSVIIYFTDFSVAEILFTNLKDDPIRFDDYHVKGLDIDAVILDLYDDTTRVWKGKDILDGLSTLGLSPMPGILVISNNLKPNEISETARSMGNKNYVYSASKTESCQGRNEQQEQHMVLFYNYIKERRSLMYSIGQPYGSIVGRVFRKELDDYLQLFRYDRSRKLPLVIYGQSGTGKELVARRIHAMERMYDTENNASSKKLNTMNDDPRKNSSKKDFWSTFRAVLINAINPDLIHSTLFGHKLGAFTGALTAHKGFLKSAENGTLFIDEIADIPLSVQVGLLRFLQDRKIQVLGDNVETDVHDVRLVFATNMDLLELRDSGSIRHDFLYRIDGITLTLKPLCDRDHSDIEELIDYFLAKNLHEIKEAEKLSYHQDIINTENVDLEITVAKFLNGTARENLRNMIYNGGFQGNVRQLQNFLRRLVLITQGSREVTEADLEKACEYALVPVTPRSKPDCGS